MRFGKLSYGMELLPYRYRLPGNFRRATFFARDVVSDELFIDEAVGLRIELGKGRVDAEFLRVEEAFERHDGHKVTVKQLLGVLACRTWYHRVLT